MAKDPFLHWTDFLPLKVQRDMEISKAHREEMKLHPQPPVTVGDIAITVGSLWCSWCS